MANNKLKNMLKKLFENKEFEMTFTDAWDTWDGYDYVTDDIVYEFKFRVVVRSVVGEGSDAVGDMDIIIDSITKDGKDHYHNWADNGYNDTTWYIKELDNRFYLDYLEGLPFDVYSTIYGHDENRTKKDTIDESVIKRIVREDQPNTVKINMGNNKLKKLLKKLEMTLTDTEDVYDGYNNVTQDIIYEFKFHVVVRRVVGEGSDAVGDLDIIVDSITKNGKDHYQYWADNGYKITWYINDLDEKFYFDYLEILPFDVDSTVYGHDEKRKGDIDESVIKRVIKEAVMDKFIDTVIPQLNNLKRKSNHSARMYGSNTIYYDKSDGQYYFRVSEPRRVMVWSDDSNFWSDDSNYNDDKVDWVTKPKTLYILTDLYREITEFIPNDEMILKWFNEKYKENAEEIQVRHSLKER
jgi:CRISPR/Cas system CMR subunit Cmr6 (Cas7 group RAMP superfamily)